MASLRTRSPTMGGSQSFSRRVRIRSPSLRRRKSSSSFSGDFEEQKVEFLGNGLESIGGGNGNKVMVVVDSSFEAKGALDWALSHTVQAHDTVVLLYVAKPSKQTGLDCHVKKVNLRAYEVLNSMKNLCQSRRPGVEVEISIREGKEKGALIVKEAKDRKVSLLVLGQRKRSMMWRLMRRLGGRRAGGGATEYCIQNSPCMAIAVRRKGKKLGGYLITTKRHKNFWLLA